MTLNKKNTNTKQVKEQDLLNFKSLVNLHLFAIIIFFYTNCSFPPTPPPLFQLLSPEHTHIHFKNEVIENDTHNILNFTNLYTGSGVGIGDFNQDGLSDIFFGGNMESSRLYLNSGDLVFKDMTQTAGVSTHRWITGVAVVDINTDGWDDIYLCVSGKADGEQRKNLLFINQQNNTFQEQAEQYGLADSAQCTQANFFDYDKDGDLDVFLIVNPTNYTLYNVNNIRKKKLNGEAESTDKLYRNDNKNGQITFTDVSREAGILIEGYSLSLNVSDLNNDNWPDVYVTNDFMTNDIIYINNQDGTFTNRAADLLQHSSFASMGVDVADINNDGQPEIYVLDMFPEDNYREKMIMGSGNYDRFQYMLKMGYDPQYSRNTLQLNNSDGTFSEIGQLANVHKTDWSWSALLADYDNDGWRDLFVTNGFRRDLGDLDYITYNNSAAFGTPESRRQRQLESIQQQPGAQLSNYIFKNEGGWIFSKKSNEWGVDLPSYSHGAAYADLDNDGDLDLVVNNVSQTAFVYENRANDLLKHHFLKVKFPKQALGAKVWIYYQNQMQYAEYAPYRGYQSTVEAGLHFGLGLAEKVDSLKVLWVDGQVDVLKDVAVDTIVEVSSRSEKNEEGGVVSTTVVQNQEDTFLLAPLEVRCHLDFEHQEDPQVDFKNQSLLPHQHSRQGPKMAVGDINGDGLEDFYVGGAATFSGTFFVQTPEQTFTQQPLNQDIEKEDISSILFDADGDGNLDLYVVSGGVVYSNQKDIYQDRLYFNDGKGNFTKKSNILPSISSSGSCVTVSDFDEDGDLDLFVGGRLTPNAYPTIPQSYLLENQGGIFRDITPKSLAHVGMVTAALWSDYDEDKDLDLILVGEFMPFTIFKNEHGHIQNTAIEIEQTSGWWNCLSAGDFDEDGDIDYIAGNLGLNSNYKASESSPVCIYANDYDQNGSLDPVLCHYIDGVEYPVPSRDALIGQIPPIKVRFNTYKKYANATFDDLFKSPEKKGMQMLKSTHFESSYFENLGNGQLKVKTLPMELQVAPLQDMLVQDVNHDEHLDVLAVGNSYISDVGTGRYDAFRGAVMLGDGQGNFTVKNGSGSGFTVNTDARSIAALSLDNQRKLIIVGSNADSLKIFQ